MPSDILGSEILDENRQFKFIKGPVFRILFWQMKSTEHHQKTQAALLEAMQERSVTIAGENYKLDFLILFWQLKTLLNRGLSFA
jgi:MoxR-like ATPase